MCEYIDSIELRNLAQIGTWPLLPAGGGHLISMETLHLLKCVWVDECICDVHLYNVGGGGRREGGSLELLIGRH